jgi:hypothetical protein
MATRAAAGLAEPARPRHVQYAVSAVNDDQVAVIVLAGEGDHFSVGHDIGTPGRDIAGRLPRGLSPAGGLAIRAVMSPAQVIQVLARKSWRLPISLVVAAEGLAAGHRVGFDTQGYLPMLSSDVVAVAAAPAWCHPNRPVASAVQLSNCRKSPQMSLRPPACPLRAHAGLRVCPLARVPPVPDRVSVPSSWPRASSAMRSRMLPASLTCMVAGRRRVRDYR